ncbi:hypothetical protein ARTSIC4J27_257 [Pseudarthrobacter siccitolerans]|uniref:Uncharacterized protein n=1 Tax=Pseudarthrobacter siccitolerans TaxID=861266 RepID=A0A024GX38_9MICC|nr:hypothetical protein [Pseudarthrobacter siccitolerans]CCQ44333.1 hypothetical protein ARTSIC4J27_257 [Pseudarthrobacter siccitolerans]
MPTLRFQLDGVPYEYEWTQPDFTGKAVQRYTYGQEPKVIASLDLSDGRTVEIHGYAEHWTNDEVVIVWTDDNFQHCSAWMPTRKVRRPDGDEWDGKFVSR